MKILTVGNTRLELIGDTVRVTVAGNTIELPKSYLVQLLEYEHSALLYAEKYGIIDYTVEDSTMTYFERFSEGTYKCTVDLNTLKETRKLIDITV